LRKGVAQSTAATSTSVTGMANGGIQSSRWGIKGSEEIGDGLKAIFTLESGVDLPSGQTPNNYQSKVDGTGGGTGSQNGQLFGRQAWVGLSDKDMGTIKFGRNYAVFYDVYSEFDPVQYAALYSPTGNSATLGAGAGVTELARQDNSVKYNGNMGNVNYTAMYKFGNVAGSTGNGSAYGFQLGYKEDRFALSAAYMGATDAPTVNRTGYITVVNTNAFLLAAKIKANDALTLKAGYQRYSLSNPSDSDSASLLAACNTYVGFTGTCSNTYVAARSVGSASTTVIDFGGDYKITDKLNLAVGFYSVNYDAAAFSPDGLLASNTVADGATNNVSEQYVSALLDYNLSKRTDVYVGGMIITNNGQGYGKAVPYASNNIIAAGMRTKF
jgi:hypothetical protein